MLIKEQSSELWTYKIFFEFIGESLGFLGAFVREMVER